MNIIGGLLVRNEAQRWLERFLDSYSVLCDKIIVIDDNSTDKTREICNYYTDYIYTTEENLFVKDESILRAHLWKLCCNQCENDDWIAIWDADDIIEIEEANLLKGIINKLPVEIGLFGLKKYDMWSETHYRSDNLWNAHTKYIPFLGRYKHNIEYSFRKTPLHCGSFPLEIINNQCAFVDKIKVKHMGWSRESDRLKKYKWYMDLDGKGTYGILEQYKSILDKSPNLEEFVYEKNIDNRSD